MQAGQSEAQYLFRFDDICPTMNWRVWGQIERVLLSAQIKPIIAVVPDNRDRQLMVDPPAKDFWAWVRLRQEEGWAVALHGYQHHYVNRNPGIIGVTAYSEFAGLPRAEQREKLARALEIFVRESVRVDAWVAPSHSFDWATVDLLAQLGVRVISDGLWRWPYTDARGVTWVPQQLGSKLPRRGPGVWTACCHHNGWTAENIAGFQRDVAEFGSRTSNLAEVVGRFAGRRLTPADRLGAAWTLYLRKLRRRLGRLRRALSRMRG